MKLFQTVIILLIFSATVFAQDDKNFPALSQDDIDGGNIRSSYYDGNALWGLIDGGADIYLEYGFAKLLFQEVEWKGIKFRVETYRMNNEEAAFGIFSVSRFKCALSDTLAKYICITPYQVQAAVGKFYISIANDKGNKEAQNLTISLFKNVLAKTKEAAFELPAIFHKKSFDSYKNQMKFMKGKLGLQNGFPNWLDLFEDYSNYEIYLLPIENKKDYAYISQIKFESAKEMQRFVSKNQPERKDDVARVFNIISSLELIFIESTFDTNKVNELIK
ncbi:MAG: hypothetical protein NTX65_08780 [Ignavibacteriales bacterium]|nr:hypothetical protein [Ignavibacteriales bacterium]